MPSKRLLRILVIADFLLVILSIIGALVGESSLPEPLRAYEQARSEADFTVKEWVLVGVSAPLIIAWLVSNVGLFFFWRSARTMYLVTVVGSLAVTPFTDVYITAGWVSAIEGMSLINTGIVLTLIYASPLKDLFEKPKNAVNP